MSPALQAQTVTVQGRVIERGATTRVAGANVELTGVGSTLTDRNGLFVFRNVPAGPYTLSLRALGYQPRQLTLELGRDTLITIELEVTPVRLDSLVVEQKTYTLRGHVDDQKTGKPIIDADVWAGSRRSATHLAGSFRLRGIAASDATALLVEAIGYEPVRGEISAQRDTTVNFRLVADPVALRILAVQIDRVVKRSSAVPVQRNLFNREWLASSVSASVSDFLRQRGWVPGSACRPSCWSWACPWGRPASRHCALPNSKG
ncbi:MAG: carboxypeptidase regulatory-like domain-containing protein [Longimicrobiales bacterium]